MVVSAFIHAAVAALAPGPITCVVISMTRLSISDGSSLEFLACSMTPSRIILAYVPYHHASQTTGPHRTWARLTLCVHGGDTVLNKVRRSMRGRPTLSEIILFDSNICKMYLLTVAGFIVR